MEIAVVTGPTGAVGTALCQKLIDEGFTVYAVCRKMSKREKNIPRQAKKIYCDLKDIRTLPEKIKCADVFYHLAWENTVGVGRNDMFSQTENIKYTLDAVKAAAALGCICFIGAGSQAECGRHNELLRSDTPCFPENGYGMAKLCAGQMSRAMCSELKIRHVWARILSVYGPFDGENSLISLVMRNQKSNGDTSLTKGEQMWDYIFSYDAADALYLMFKKGRNGAVYTLGSGRIRPLKEYVQEIKEVMGGNGKLNFGEIPYGKDQIMYLGADITEMKNELGFTPEYSFKDGINKIIEIEKENREYYSNKESGIYEKGSKS